MINKNRLLKNAVPIICLAGALCVLYYINTKILLYADDYFYGTFFKDGIINFFKLNTSHYITYNGRIFIHILAEITLIFGTYLFPVVNVLFLIGICVFSFKFQNGGYNRSLIAYAAIFFSAIMLLDVKMLRESLLWISSSFNYTLGAALIFALLVSQNHQTKSEEPDKSNMGKNGKWVALLAFLCGATTEQYGFVAICAICIICAICKAKNNFKLKKMALVLVPCIIGWFSVMFSPATFGRLLSENQDMAETGLIRFFELICKRFCTLSYIMSENNCVILFVAFGILSGLLFYRTQPDKKLKGLFFGMSYSGAILVLKFLDYLPYINVISFCLSVCFLIYSAVFMLKHENHMSTAVVIFAALASVFIMLFTNTVEFRTTFPFALFLIAICSDLAVKSIKHEKIYDVALPAFLAISCVVFFPTIKAYSENKKIMDGNIKLIENSTIKKKCFNIDFNDEYRHTLAYENGFFYNYFRKYYNIGDDVEIYFVGDRLPKDSKNTVNISIDSEYMEFEAYEIAGSNYFLLGDLIEALKLDDTDDNGDQNDEYDEQALAYSECKIYLNGIEINLTAYVINGKYYFKLRDIGKALDFYVGWDGEENLIVIRTFESYAE
ncbi:MAG: copper amine oxidase N-terminal domain-containing protein [Oscillospiraceae bacterium]|nr:copper amine oxidase N-terminal domain-containing protein [Oscillospiraceae bacterium]